MYCLTIYDNHYEKINKIGYIPVGLGKNIYSTKFLLDSKGENISHKNPFYGEYSFHYWLWKNEIKNLKKENWIGFCQYRKFWLNTEEKIKNDNINKLSQNLVRTIPKELDEFEAILGEPLFINQFKFSKFIKKDIFKIVRNPKLLLDKNKRNIKFHFDLMHGEGNLNKGEYNLIIGSNNLIDSDYKTDHNCLKLSKENNCIISTGGGLPVRGSNFDIMNNSGYVLTLDASVDIIVKRLKMV